MPPSHLPPPAPVRAHRFVAFSAALLGSAVVLARSARDMKDEPAWLVLPLAVAAVGAPAGVILRSEASPLGWIAAPLGFLLSGALLLVGRPAREALLLLVLPPGLLLLRDLVVQPLLRRAAADRALRDLDGVTDPARIAPHLGHEAQLVRERAAYMLGALPAAAVREPLRLALRAAEPRERAAALLALSVQARSVDGFDLARDLLREQVKAADLEQAADAAKALAGLDAQGDLIATQVASEERPAVRLAYARGLLLATSASDGTGSRPSLAAMLLAGVLADPKVADDLRAEALDLFDAVPPREVRAVACPLLVRTEVTPEVLWLFMEQGRPEDAPHLARWVASEPFERALAACEALDAILERAGEPGFGPHAAATRAVLQAAIGKLRTVHPKGDNDLADDLVERLEGIADYAAGPIPAEGPAPGAEAVASATKSAPAPASPATTPVSEPPRPAEGPAPEAPPPAAEAARPAEPPAPAT